MLTLYGIPNCDTCRKARKWLDGNSVKHRFHDLRADGLEKTALVRWIEHVGWQLLLNTRSTTWRGLPEADRKKLNGQGALELMLQHPTLIKRPVLESTQQVLVGFSAEAYAKLVSA